MTNQLSTAQSKFMSLVGLGSFMSPTEGSNVARECSAWHRTANSLAKRGLVEVFTNGSVFVARLPTNTTALNAGWHKVVR